MEYISNYLLVYKVIIPKMSVLYVVVYYFILYIFFRSYKKKYLILLISLLIIIKYSYLFDNSYYVYYLDVGQGDTSLIKYKNKSYLIDTGGVVEYTKEKWKVKKEYKKSDTYITFFKSIGLEKIDYLIITHGDYDHMGDAVNLVNNFKVDNVIFNCGSLNKLEIELIKVLDNKQIKYYSCITKLDNLYFLQTKEYDNENDNSNVIYTELYDYKFMFMGDASIITEKEIFNTSN
jgi:competence protein ComEC